MRKELSSWRIAGPAALVLSVFALAMPAAVTPAQAQIDQASDEVEENTKEGARSQDRIDRLDAEGEELMRIYRGVLRELEDTRTYNEQLAAQIAQQEEQKAEIQAQIERVSTISRDVTPLMTRMAEALEVFVKLDKPFLPEERAKRVREVNEILTDDVSDAERFRRILIAYQVEMDYGRSIEAYESNTVIDGETVKMDFLMVGRAAFYRQTLDRDQSWVWKDGEGGQGEWVELPASANSQIKTALDMAREFIPPDMFVLPMFGAEVAEAQDSE